MKTTKRMLLPLLAAAVISASWYFFTGPALVINSTQNALSYDFTVSSLLPHSAGDLDARYSVLLNPGDGRYVMAETDPKQANPLDQVLTYAYRSPVSSAGYTPYAEATEIYDDKTPPPQPLRMVPTEQPAGSDQPLSFPTASIFRPAQNSSVDSYKKNLGIYPIRIDPARRIVSGHGVTYVVTFENLAPQQGTSPLPPAQGTIEFKYDKNVLDIIQVKDDTKPNTWVHDLTNSTVSQPFDNLKEGEQRSMFFIFKTKANLAVGTQITPAPTASLNVETEYFWNKPAYTTDMVSSHNTVAASHDPNYKSISPGSFCTDYSGSLVFKVEFQNDGAESAKTVKIEDELDYLFSPSIAANDINAKAYIAGRPAQSLSPPTRLSNRKFLFTIGTGGALKGNKEAGYGKTFLDADTRGYLEITIDASKLDDKPKCNALCNRASIVFDCNPPIETNLALSNITCLTCNACQDSVIFLPPGTMDSATALLPILPSGALSSLSGYNYFKWYPASAVSNPTTAAATFTTKRSTTFTLVASSTNAGVCKRFIFHRRLEVPCNLNLTATATPQNQTGCPDTWTYNVVANVTGMSAAANLVWNDKTCSPGTIPTYTNLQAGLLHIAVTDTETGCYAEKWIDTRPKPILIDDDPSDCVAKLIVSGGQPPYTYQWTWNGGSVSGVTSLNLKGKTGVSVTVTDAYQCTAVFKPVQGNCGPVLWTGTVRLALMVVAGIAIALFIYMRFFRNTRSR